MNVVEQSQYNTKCYWQYEYSLKEQNTDFNNHSQLVEGQDVVVDEKPG
jgi:hypothetical protein